VIDLPSSIGVGVEVGGIGSSVKGVYVNENGIGIQKSGSGILKMRNGGATAISGPTGVPNVSVGPLQRARFDDKESRGRGESESDRVKHYDADGDNFLFVSFSSIGSNIEIAFLLPRSSSAYQGHRLRRHSHPRVRGDSFDF
jgi:hypothetical protein